MIARLDRCGESEEVEEAEAKEGEKLASEQAEEPTTQVLQIDLRLPVDIFATGQDPAWLLQEVAEVGEVIELKANASELPLLEDMDPESCYLTWTVLLRTDRGREAVEEVFLFVNDGHAVRITDVSAAHNHGVDLTAADKKLGELLVEEGVVAEKVVVEALKKQ